MAVEETWAQTHNQVALPMYGSDTPLTTHSTRWQAWWLFVYTQCLLDMVTRTECTADRSVRGILLQNHQTAVNAAPHMPAVDTINLTKLMVLGSTQPQMTTGDIFWRGGGKGGPCGGLTCADCLEIWKPQGLSRDCLNYW